MARKNYIREKTIYCGTEYLEIDIVPVTNKPEAGKEKEKESKPKQQNLNDKNSKRKFVQIGNTNFGIGDNHISCTYDDEHIPATLSEAERNAKNYLNRVKRRMKKETGKDLKYMLVTEYTPVDETEEKAVRIHHHIIINGGLDRDTLEDLWSEPRKKGEKKGKSIGYVNADRLQPNENGIEALCNYINKRKKGCKKWSTSQNLDKPKRRKNDSKFNFKKVRELAKTPEDKEHWRKLYTGYEPTKIEFVHNDYTGWAVYLKLRRIRD